MVYVLGGIVAIIALWAVGVAIKWAVNSWFTADFSEYEIGDHYDDG